MTGIDRCFRITLDSPFAEDSPSPFRERVGERALLKPAPTPPANPVREQARSYSHDGIGVSANGV